MAKLLFRRYAQPNGLRFSLWIVLGFVIFLFDQALKFFFEHSFALGESVPVMSSFNLVLAHNRGAAFSFLANASGWQTWFFCAMALAVTGVILVMLWRHNHQKLFSFALTLIAAGAMGNLTDRLVYGYVIDFLDFYWNSWHWPAFNLADIAICLGAALLLLDELLGVSRER